MAISSKQLLLKIKPFGFTSYGDHTLRAVNDALKNCVKFCTKQHMKGGRVTMPMEYYGIDSGNYYAPADLPHGYDGEIMDIVTDTVARPSLPYHNVAMSGGGAKFCVTVKSVKDASDVTLTPVLTKYIKAKFESLMTEILAKISKSKSKSTKLETADFEKVLKNKKYKCLT